MLRVLTLDPVAGAVGRAKALRYDTFEAELAGMGEDGRGVREFEPVTPASNTTKPDRFR
jgi:hypothetical protein